MGMSKGDHPIKLARCVLFSPHLVAADPMIGACVENREYI